MKTSYLITIAAMVLGLTGVGCEYTKVLYPIDGKDLTETAKIEETTETTETVVPILPSDPTSPSPDVVPPPLPQEEILSEEPPPSEIPPGELPSDEAPEDPPAVSGDTTPPTILAFSPPAGEGATLDTSIFVFFSESMDSATITKDKLVITTMTEGSPTATAVQVVQVHPWHFEFVLDAPLAPNTLYTVVVNKTVKDLAGNQMVNPHAWSFRTIVDASPPEDVDSAETMSLHRIDSGMVLWNGAHFDWQGAQAHELDILYSMVGSEDPVVTSENGIASSVRVGTSLKSKIKRFGPGAENFTYRGFLAGVAYDRSTLRRVSKNHTIWNLGDCHWSAGVMDPIDVAQEFGQDWAQDTTGRYLYYVVLRGYEIDADDSMGPEDFEVGVYLADDHHRPTAGKINPRYNVDFNGPVNDFNCGGQISYDVIGIDTTAWAAVWFEPGNLPFGVTSETETQSQDSGLEFPVGSDFNLASLLRYSVRNDLTFPFEIPSIQQTFVGLRGWGHENKIDGDTFEMDSIGSLARVIAVNGNQVTVEIAGEVQGYRSTSANSNRALNLTPDKTRGYVFACKDFSICRVKDCSVEDTADGFEEKPIQCNIF